MATTDRVLPERVVSALKQARASVAFLINTTTSEVNRVNQRELLAEIEAILADAPDKPMDRKAAALQSALRAAAEALEAINSRLPVGAGLSKGAVARIDTLSHDAAYYAREALAKAA